MGNVVIFKDITTNEILEELEAESKKWEGLTVDMNNKDERKFVKDKATFVNGVLKKLDRKRIDESKEYKVKVEAEALDIKERLEIINLPFTALIDAYTVERAKVLAEEKRIIKEAEDEKLWIEMLEDAHKDNAEFDERKKSQRLMEHMDAINDNHSFDQKKVQAEADRIIREKKIAEGAAEAARLEVEKNAQAEIKRLADEKQDAIDLAETNKQIAIQADLDAADLREEMRVDHHKRMIKHIVDCGCGWIGGQPQPFGILFRELEEKVLIDDSFEEFKSEAEEAKVNAIANLNRLQNDANKKAADAETKRLDDIKQAEINTANKIETDRIAKEKLANDLAIENMQNKEKLRATMTEVKMSIMALGVPEEFAILVTKGLKVGSVARVSKIQF